MKFGVLSFVLISIFYQINYSRADWDAERRGLIVNQRYPNFDYYFPSTVRKSTSTRKIIFRTSNEGRDRTYYLCIYDPNFGETYEGCVFAHELEVGETNAFCYTENDPNQQMVKPGAVEFENAQCGAGNYIGTHYGYYYQICKFKDENEVDQSSKLLLVYTVCYDIPNKYNLYSSFTIESPQLFTNTHLAAEANVEFVHDYATVNYNGLTYGLNVVAPPKLVPFALQRVGFYERPNLAFRLVSLDEAWNSLIIKLKEKFKVFKDPVHVFAGTYGTLASVTYGSDHHTIIPCIWWIVVYNKKKSRSTSIIMHNEKKNTVGSHELYCNTSVCHYVGLDLPNVNEDTLMYCCDATVIASQLNLPPANAEKLFHFGK